MWPGSQRLVHDESQPAIVLDAWDSRLDLPAVVVATTAMAKDIEHAATST